MRARCCLRGTDDGERRFAAQIELTLERSTAVQIWKSIAHVLVGSNLLASSAPSATAPPRAPAPRTSRGRPRAREGGGLPDDPGLPAIAAIRERGIAGMLPELGLGDRRVECVPLSYLVGARATFEARARGDRFVVKAYAQDPTAEVELYWALAAAGLAGVSGPRVPRLLAWSREHRVIAIGWLDGPESQRLLQMGQGGRAGELAAAWLRRISSVNMKLGPCLDGAHRMRRVGEWLDALTAAEPALGPPGREVADLLARTLPADRAPQLVHGTLYCRHILDLGDAPGVIDWQRYGQGPPELDAGVFLATIWRAGLKSEVWAREAARTEAAFLAGTRGLLEPQALAWHRAAAMTMLSYRLLKLRESGWVERARMYLSEAAQIATEA
jgi:aminoglycoside phosphotransferase (APT) family kinase protein